MGRSRPTTSPANIRDGRTANSAGATTPLKNSAAPSQIARTAICSTSGWLRLTVGSPPGDPSGAVEERIRDALAADRRRRPMTGQDVDIILELEDSRQRV